VTVDLFGLLLVNGLWLAAGIGITSAAGWWRGRGVLGALGISYLCGVAAYGVIAQTLYVCGVAMTRLEIVVVCAILTAGCLLRGPAPPRRFPTLGIAGIVVCAVLALLAVDAWFQPLWAYDSWTFWTPKAHALAALNGLDARWFAQPQLVSRDYPLLLPSIEAAGFRFTGYETGLLDLQSWFFVAALLLVFAEVVVPRGPRWSWAIPVLVVISPSLADQLASAEADIPLAALFTAAVACAWVWHLERARGALMLFAVLGAGTAATKAEGLPFVIVLTVVVAAAEVRRRPRAAAALVAAGAAALVVAVVPWRLWVNAHHIPQQESFSRVTDASFLAGQVDRLPLAAGYVVSRLFDPHAWILLVPLLVALTVIAAVRFRRPEALLVGALVLLCLASLLLAYWTSPFEIHYHLHTSARRVITAPILAWAFLVPLLWRPVQAGGAFGRPGYPQDP
jgi:hypothetical protein